LAGRRLLNPLDASVIYLDVKINNLPSGEKERGKVP